MAHAIVDKRRHVLERKGVNKANPQDGKRISKETVQKINHGHILLLPILKVRRFLTRRDRGVQHVANQHQEDEL